ncbi:unnamed protein product [Vitrella brassicaformis CCMP3155]|uniref:Cyclic nucleotide-binding domain-containing protein n=1 Tax=Vitrella brassicaformis (strain CCMP3155) TaxID=1169540 RepID=A0A0G4ENA4_VITBC|nr:unnamed protein product [Vitrella brassicaformis CCMP3155]|eukprot:CEL99317.1 unnamed protein product [Vitrella brassicaformis CCMP3155]
MKSIIKPPQTLNEDSDIPRSEETSSSEPPESPLAAALRAFGRRVWALCRLDRLQRKSMYMTRYLSSQLKAVRSAPSYTSVYGEDNDGEYVLLPYGAWSIGWSFVMLGAICMLAFGIPIALAFQPDTKRYHIKDEGGWFWVERVLDALFLADVAVQLRTAVEMEGHMVTDLAYIGRLYRSSWFFPDLALALPYEVLVFAIPFTIFIDTFRIIKFLRLLRMGRILRQWKNGLFLRISELELIKFVGLILLSVHWLSCVLLIMGHRMRDDGREWLAVNEVEGKAHAKQYLLALVWTLQTMSSVGYGSPLLTTPQERHFAIWGMIIGSCIFAYGITSSINFYKEMYEAQKNFRHKMDLLYELCQSKTIPGPLAARMRQLFHLQNKMKKGGAAVETQSRILAELPPVLMREVILFINRHIVDNIDVLKASKPTRTRQIGGDLVACSCTSWIQGIPRVCAAKLVLAFQMTFYGPDEVIVRKGDTTNQSLFVIADGRAKMLGANRELVGHLGKHAVFGEFMMLDILKERTFTVVSETFCDVRVLPKEAFKRISASFPALKRTCLERALHNLRVDTQKKKVHKRRIEMMSEIEKQLRKLSLERRGPLHEQQHMFRRTRSDIKTHKRPSVKIHSSDDHLDSDADDKDHSPKKRISIAVDEGRQKDDKGGKPAPAARRGSGRKSSHGIWDTAEEELDEHGAALDEAMGEDLGEDIKAYLSRSDPRDEEHLTVTLNEMRGIFLMLDYAVKDHHADMMPLEEILMSDAAFEGTLDVGCQMSELQGGMGSPTCRGIVQEKLDLLQEDAGVGKDEADDEVLREVTASLKDITFEELTHAQRYIFDELSSRFKRWSIHKDRSDSTGSSSIAADREHLPSSFARFEKPDRLMTSVLGAQRIGRRPSSIGGANPANELFASAVDSTAAKEETGTADDENSRRASLVYQYDVPATNPKRDTRSGQLPASLLGPLPASSPFEPTKFISTLATNVTATLTSTLTKSRLTRAKSAVFRVESDSPPERSLIPITRRKPGLLPQHRTFHETVPVWGDMENESSNSSSASRGGRRGSIS